MKKQFYLWACCLLAALLGFSSCSDDDEGASVGSREMLIGEWEAVSYYSEDWENGELVGEDTEDYAGGNGYFRLNFHEDGMCDWIEGYTSSGSEYTDRVDWTYSGNQLAYDWGDGELEIWTVTLLTETELEYEVRYSETDEGIRFETYEKYVFKKKQ